MPLAEYTGTLGLRTAAHLLRRTTFGPTKADIDNLVNKTAAEAFEALTTNVDLPSPPLDLKTGKSWLPKPIEDTNSENGDLNAYFKSWWLDQMLNSGANMKEKIVFLYHTFFPTIDSAVENATALYYQNALFRFYAYGNIKTLAKKMVIDNAMLLLLDGRQNEVGRPNENYARELFELHTVGKGPALEPGDYTNYTEHDIQVAARILSGWENDKDFAEIDGETGLPTGILKGVGDFADRHDASNDPERKFSAAFNNKIISHPAEVTINTGTPNEQAIANVVNGQARKDSVKDQVSQLVDMIFEQRATALNFSRKIYRFFVYYIITDEVETNVISPLADTLIANSYEILPVLKELLTSQYFFDPENDITTDNIHADIIKSPIDLTLGTLRFFNVKTPLASASLQNYYDFYKSLLASLTNQGIDLYEPYDVAGYDAYHQEPDFHRNWITVNTLAFRYEFGLNVANNKFSDMLEIDFAAYIKTNVDNPSSPSAILQHFVDYLLPEVISTTLAEGFSFSRFDYFQNILRDGIDDVIWVDEWKIATNSGDYSKVNTELSKFIAALLKSPEYQLM